MPICKYIFIIKDSNAGKSSNVAGQAFSSGDRVFYAIFYAIFCIRAISKAQHNNLLNLITLMNKVRIDILRRHSFSQIINSEIKIALLRTKQRNKIIFGMN